MTMCEQTKNNNNKKNELYEKYVVWCRNILAEINQGKNYYTLQMKKNENIAKNKCEEK